MSSHLAVSMSIAATAGPIDGRADVLDCEISHDPLRTPQILVRATVPSSQIGILDDKAREPANLYISARSYNAGTLRDFDAAAPPATLGTLDWSSKDSDPAPLDGASLDYSESRYELKLLCTEVIVSPRGGTADVTLASPDYLLEQIANAGPDWMPDRHGDGNYRLKSCLRQLLAYLEIPLTVPVTADGDVIFTGDIEPWKTGETARAWLDALRAVGDSIWMVSAVEQTIQPYYSSGLPAPSMSANALERTVESSTELSPVTGHARWADGYLLIWEWNDGTTDRVQTDFASLGGIPWQQCRKIITERIDRSPTSLTAAARLARAQRYRTQTTWVVPMGSLDEPYRDLSTWLEMRGRLSSLTYRYPDATVHGTQIEE